MEEQVNLLADDETVFNRATPGVRFADYVVDIIVYYIIMFLIGMSGLLAIDPDNKPMLYLIAFAVLLIYYTLMEGVTGGKTLGKYITGTRAVKEDGSPITFSDALMRSLSRLVPFEPLSTFGGNPWHDKWTKTMVIKERR